MAGTAEAFAFDEVTVRRGDSIRAVDRLSAVIPDQGITAIVGPSGSGKSTLLRLCNRLEVPTSGRVLFRAQDVAGLDPLRLRRQVGMVFQRPTPFTGSVADNLRVASPDADTEKLVAALAAAALDEAYLDREARALSGGEAQRVCLARTLITDPEVLLLDEPTAAVDQDAARAIEEAIRTLADLGTTVLWVSHDPQQVDRVADRTFQLERGRWVGTGAARGGVPDGQGEAES
jgi:putative ABC transport system ATP-binding protein